jgi:hypothetical protein
VYVIKPLMVYSALAESSVNEYNFFVYNSSGKLISNLKILICDGSKTYVSWKRKISGEFLSL